MHTIETGQEGMKQALGRIASGLYVAGAMYGERRVGMLCSFVEQAGFAPPMVSISLGVDRVMNRALEAGAVFSLNILGEEDKKLMAAFASGRNEDPFEGQELIENEYGVPQLAEALASLVCRPVSSLPAGDHVLHVAEVLAGSLHSSGEKPMIRIRTNGFGY